MPIRGFGNGGFRQTSLSNLGSGVTGKNGGSTRSPQDGFATLGSSRTNAFNTPKNLNLNKPLPEKPLPALPPEAHQGSVSYVKVGGTPLNPFGHAAVKTTDHAGGSKYYDINNHGSGGGFRVSEYTPQQFMASYGKRNPVEVPVNVPEPPRTSAYLQGQIGRQWDYGVVNHNCVTFANDAIKQGGGAEPSSKSWHKRPETFPDDALRAYQKRNRLQGTDPE